MDKVFKIKAPTTVATKAGAPKYRSTLKFIFLKVKPNLNKLLVKWTIAVAAIAIEIGMKIAKIGSSIVPSPKPEKNVRTAANKATKKITMSSTRIPRQPAFLKPQLKPRQKNRGASFETPLFFSGLFQESFFAIPSMPELISTNSIPTPTTKADNPKETTEVNSEALKKEPFIATARSGSSRSNSA